MDTILYTALLTYFSLTECKKFEFYNYLVEIGNRILSQMMKHEKMDLRIHLREVGLVSVRLTMVISQGICKTTFKQPSIMQPVRETLLLLHTSASKEPPVITALTGVSCLNKALTNMQVDEATTVTDSTPAKGELNSNFETLQTGNSCDLLTLMMHSVGAQHPY